MIKFRYQTNFDNTYDYSFNHNNPLLWRCSHSYAEGLVGRVRSFIKMTQLNV